MDSLSRNSKAQVDNILQNDTNKGAPVHTFNPDSSPAEKAASAGKGQDKLASVKKSQPSERAVPIEKPSPAMIPTITVEDLDDGKKTFKAEDTSQSVENVQSESASIPGAIPGNPASVIPDWYKVGWRQVYGIDDTPLGEGDAKDKGVLDVFLAEQFYGAWYHNAAIIIFAVFASHFLTRFNFGWGWLFIILAVCSTYYSTSVQRVHRSMRDDIQRELVKTRLGSEHESADWMNHFLDRFWLIYEPVLCKTIVASVDQVLSTNTPTFLDSLRLSHFTLGTKAPRITQVRTFPNTDEDVVMMDWGVSFIPADVSGSNSGSKSGSKSIEQRKPKIVLAVRVGKGLATASMPILLEDITFSGSMRVRLKLMSNFPHIQLVDFTFLEKPVIDYVLKPVGGETFGFDIANVPGLSSFIRDLTHGTLSPMMYDPNVFTLNLEQMLSGKPLDAAIGVLKVTIQSARGIKGTKIGGGTPDPFISLSINSRSELARTKYKNNTYNPSWMETKFILINSLHENLTFDLYDYNDHRKNTLLGSALFDLKVLEEDSTQECITAPLLKDGKDRGELRFDVAYHPVIGDEENQEEAQAATVGIVRLTIHQAKDLDQSKSMSGDLNPMAKVYLGSDTTKAVFATPKYKRTTSPVWEASHEYLCSDKHSSTLAVKVIDDRDFLKDPVVGYMSIKLTDLLEIKKEPGRDWFPLSGCRSGKIRLSAEWKPLSMAGSMHGADQYKPPIGVVRLLLDKAVDVKNVEAALGGKSDPYVRVLAENVTKARTEVVNNNLNPVWDQIVYIPVHSLKDTLLLECMDYQHLTRDRTLGTTELSVAELAEESDDFEYPYKPKGVKSAANPLRLDSSNQFKGQLHYTANFIPSLALKGVKFDGQPNEIQSLAATNRTDEEGGVATVDDASVSSSDEEAQPLPNEPTVKSQDKRIDTKKSVESNFSNGAPSNGNGNLSLPSVTKNSKPSSTKSEKGVDMSIEELLTKQSGIIVFNVISGELSKKGRIEVLLDDGYWPCFGTSKSGSTHAHWNYVGEGFMKEIDFGQVWLRLNDAAEGEKDDVVGQWKGAAKEFLKGALAGPQKYVLTDENEGNVASLMIEARYVPVPIQLEPRESVNNQGTLRVELLDGREIRGVDRGGKSDPYAVFTLNGQKVFKSQTKKKTVAPEWNENFIVQVPSRVAAEFTVEIFDWNQIEQAKSLGIGKINLADIEPFEAIEKVINLISQKHGEKGQINVRLMFQPEIIAKSRKNTSTFTTAGRAMTQLGGLPVSAGKGVLHGVAGVFRRGDREHDEEIVQSQLPAGQASQPIAATNSFGGKMVAPDANAVTEDGTLPAHESGTLRVTVFDAKDLSQHETKPYVTIRLGDKEFKTKHTAKTATPEWNESFIFAASVLTPKIDVLLHDHKTLGKDKDLGDAHVDIWRHISHESASSADVFLELRPSGLLRLRLEFDPSSNLPGSSSSLSSGEHITRTTSIVNASRFSIRGRRPNDHDE